MSEHEELFGIDRRKAAITAAAPARVERFTVVPHGGRKAVRALRVALAPTQVKRLPEELPEVQHESGTA